MRRFPHWNDILDRAGKLARDWRIRTLVPLIVINIAAFAGLYALMYHFAISNLVETHRDGAAILFDELQLHFGDMMMDHTDTNCRARVARQAAAHHLRALTFFDGRGNAIAATNTQPTSDDFALAQKVLQANQPLWAMQPGNVIAFGSPIVNDVRCQSCHASNDRNLGVMQISFDVTDGVAEARQRVREKFAVAGVAWIAILALLMWTARVVISRPLAKIEKSIGTPGRTQDLEQLAHKINDTLWSMIETQRKREADISTHMARAEQLAALGELAAGLTHEIKNPLAGVIAALDLLRSETVEFERRDLYEQMLNELRRVTGTVESLLRLAKPQPPQRTDVDMSRVVAEVTSLFGARLRRQDVRLEVEMVGTMPLLQLDAGLMVQLLVNLLTNSMQATDRGGIVKVLLTPWPHQDGVVLAVSDTGRGIPREALERIFVPFFTTKEEGTGLGLAICRQIVEQHGGTITVESEIGNGTRVVVLLPDLHANERKELHGALAAG